MDICNHLPTMTVCIHIQLVSGDRMSVYIHILNFPSSSTVQIPNLNIIIQHMFQHFWHFKWKYFAPYISKVLLGKIIPLFFQRKGSLFSELDSDFYLKCCNTEQLKLIHFLLVLYNNVQSWNIWSSFIIIHVFFFQKFLHFKALYESIFSKLLGMLWVQ